MKINLSFSSFLSIWMASAVLYQFGYSFYLSSQIASLLIQSFVLVFFAFSIKSVKSQRVDRHLFILLVLYAAYCAISITFHSVLDKNILVLFLGFLDNNKFVLVLMTALLLNGNSFILDEFGYRVLNILYIFIVFSVLFGVVQQLLPQLIYIFPSSVDFAEIYRYGLLRVPSIFGSINAFSKIGFLLIPLGYLLKKDMKFAIGFALLSFVLAFSRQFLVGIFVSLIIASLQSGFFVKKKFGKFVGIGVCFVILLTVISSLGQDDARNSKHDGKFFEIPKTFIRGAVAITSLKAANDNPLFGVGYGYFGGNIGKKFGLNQELENYGMMELIPFFDLTGVYYTDTLWPQLLGESGYLGAFFYLMIFYFWYRKIKSQPNQVSRLVCFFCINQFLFNGVAGPVFNFTYFSIPILFCTLFIVNYHESPSNNKYVPQ